MSGLHLPLDICREILVRLPGGSLFRFRAVCKTWRTVIDDPSFAWAHTNHHLSSSPHTTLVIKETLFDPDKHNLHTFDLDAVNIFTRGDQAVSGSILDLTRHESGSLLWRLPVSACNGLLLVYPFGLNPLEIWNLSTHERLQLPKECFLGQNVFFGLGYDQAAQDFKALVMRRGKTHVYSLRSDAWTTTTGDCFGGIDSSWAPENHGVFLCGALHWLLYDNKITALDVGTGKHRHVQVNALRNTLDFTKRIDVLGGCLAVSGYSIKDSQCLQVWVMRDYGSDDESWTMLLSVVDPTNVSFGLRPVAYFEDRNQVLLKKVGGPGFFVFDIMSDSMKTLLTGRCFLTEAQIIPQSILRLRDHCGGGASRIIPMQRPTRRVSFSFETKH